MIAEFKKIYLDYYLKSPEGMKWQKFFADFKSIYAKRFEDSQLKDAVDSVNGEEGYFKKEFLRTTELFEIEDCDYEDFDDFAEDLKQSFISENEARFFKSYIPVLSCELFLRYPEYAIPVLFPKHFCFFEDICKEFGIALGPLPGKVNHEKRFNYYFELCRAFYEFRIDVGLSPVELCCFIYGLAHECIFEKYKTALKQASHRIFLAYASPADVAGYLDKDELSEDEDTVWQGREEMSPGDIVLMYERSPNKRFGSVWRTKTSGYDDPFDDWSGKVVLCNPVRIPHVEFAKFSKDPVWSKNPLIPAHMQNGAGRECSVDEYEALFKMIKEVDPDFDLAKLPPPPEKILFDGGVLVNEHDVEIKLLEPLLQKLGFKSKDWVTQFSVKIGRDNSSRPDYVVNLNTSSSMPTAEYVFEAKLTIPTKAQLKKDYCQALAYGRLLDSRRVCLVAKEGVWCWREEDNFDFETRRHFSWAELKDPAKMSELSSLILK